MVTAKPRFDSYDLYADDGGFIKSIPSSQIGPYTRLALAMGMVVVVDADE